MEMLFNQFSGLVTLQHIVLSEITIPPLGSPDISV